MKTSVSNISCELLQILEGAGLSWPELQQDARQIILFGSRAAGVARKDSDWDLLCIGSDGAKGSGDVDIVWVPSSKTREPAWLGSDLANHVKVYGKWLHGTDDWTANVSISKSSIGRKKKLIETRLQELSGLWDQLSDPDRLKHVRTIRRDLQRFIGMQSGEATPPTPLLDARWKEKGQPGSSWCLLLKESRLTSIGSNLERLGEYA